MSTFYTNVARSRNNLLYRGIKNGKRVMKKVPFRPTLYLTDKDGKSRSIYGHKVSPMQFEKMSEAKAFIERNKDIAGFDIYGTEDYVCQYIQEKWPGNIEYDESQIVTINLDIEVRSEKGFPEPDEALWPVDLITFKTNLRDEYVVLSLYDWNRNITQIDEEIRDKIVHIQYKTEEELLRAFVKFFQTIDPDVVTGWNVQGFDMIYLYNRISRLAGEQVAKRLSPWEQAERRSIKTRWGKEKTVVDLVGIAQVDFMEVFIKFGHKYGPQENYKLDTICNTVLGTSKLSYEEYSSLFELAIKNPQKYTDYNIIDVYRVEQMINKTKLMSLVYAMIYRAGCNMMDAFGTTRIWDTIIYRRLMQDNVVVQPMKRQPSTKYEGAYVKEIEPSNFTYVASFDIASLYPNIMIEWNMSPETLQPEMVDMNVERALDEGFPVTTNGDFAVAANGARFSKTKQGFIPSVLEGYYSDRKLIQKEYGKLAEEKERRKQAGETDFVEIDTEMDRLYNEQMSIKILINSCYGAIGNAYFRHYDLRIAEGITLTGQLVIRWAQKTINKAINKVLDLPEDRDHVCYVDTDSNYINMAPLVERFKPEDPIQFMDEVCEGGIGPALDNGFKALGQRMNTFKPRMEMGREVLADRGFWTSKKRYALRVWDQEGVRFSEPKIKIMGLDAVKSSTPVLMREWMKEYIKLVLADREYDAEDFIEDKREEFINMTPEEIAFPRTANLADWQIGAKGIPFHVRASLTFNGMLAETGLDKTYSKVYDGDKVKYLYLVEPNHIQSNIIAFPDVLPREAKLVDKIDYQTQFYKGFEKPMEAIRDAMGWHATGQTTL